MSKSKTNKKPEAEVKQVEYKPEPIGKLKKRLETIAKKGGKGGYVLTEQDIADIKVASKFAELLHLFCKKGGASVVRRGNNYTTLYTPQLKELCSSLAYHAICDATPGSED